MRSVEMESKSSKGEQNHPHTVFGNYYVSESKRFVFL